jgi:DNA-binding MarR family transcriptional regulator
VSKQPAADLVERVARAAEEFGAMAGEVDAAVAARLRVNGTDLRIVGLVHGAGSMSAGELATAAGLSPAATTTAVQRLVAGGHLVREVDPADRRRTVLTLTDSVLATIRESYEPVGQAGVELLSGYRPAELAVVERFLRAGVDLQRTHAARIRALAAP